MKIDKDKLKESLSVDDIVYLLRELGAEDVIDLRDSKNHLITNTICHNISNGKMKLYYYPDSFTFHCYTGCGSNFDIYDLVHKNYLLKGIELHFSAIVEWVANKTGKAFGFGFSLGDSDIIDDWEYLHKIRKKKPQNIELPVYNEKILDVFSKAHHPAFLEDNITHEAMEKFEISYYNKDNRVVIPHRHYETGVLVGIKGRTYNQWEIDAGYKYLPITVQGTTYSHSTHGNLYGLFQNSETIRRLKKVIVFESEKSVLQCESYFPNNNFSVATSGSSMSQQQVRVLLELGIDEIIFAFDKEFYEVGDKNEAIQMKKMLKLGRKFSNYIQTYVIWDKFQMLDYKDSPSDKGRDTLLNLMKSKEEIRSSE